MGARLLRIAALYPIAAGLALLILPALGQQVGPVALATILIPYAAIAGLLLLPVAIARPLLPFRAGYLVLAIALVARLGSEWVSVPTSIGSSDGVLSTLTWNLEFGARAGDDASAGILAHDADVVALQELGSDHAGAIERAAELTARYPARVLHPAPGVGGIGLLSRHPIVESIYGSDPPMIEATLDVDGTRVTVITAHPLPGRISMAGPLPIAFDSRGRDAAIKAVSSRIGDALARNDSLIVLGDFNVAPTEPAYRDLVTGLRDAHVEIGQGPGWTWRPSRFEWTGLGFLRIDYAFSSPDMPPVQIDEYCGLPGDHCQLETRFELGARGVGVAHLVFPADGFIRALPVTVLDTTGLLLDARAVVGPMPLDRAEAVLVGPDRIRLA